MKEIKLTRGYVAMVDDEDYDELAKFRWTSSVLSNNIYAFRTSNRNINSSMPIHIQMHRQIMGLTNPKVEVDHIDGNGLNNQKNNLRPCTRSENAYNCSSFINSSSKYVGVSYARHGKRIRRWLANIKKDGVPVRIGCYLTEDEAALARDMFVLDNKMEFAKLNILTRK